MPFTFQQFVIDDSHTAMKVGIDGVLLGVWAKIIDGSKILDVGCGSGLISLIIAQRFPCSLIKAIDVNSDAIIDCDNNFKQSKWSNRMEAINTDFLDYDSNDKFDYIISNPPFFYTSFNSVGTARRMARVNDFLPIKKFFEKSKSILKPKGEIIVIYSSAFRENVIKSALLNGLYLKRELQIQDTNSSEIKRNILHFVMNTYTHEVLVESLALKNDDKSYSLDFRKLTEGFYL